jgi:steroid 5-alpha reductase family enzyme
MISLYILAYLYVFWLLYLVFTSLYRAHLSSRLTGITKLLGYPIIIVAVVVDWLANFTIAVVVFQEAPESLNELVTGRLWRYLQEPEGRNKRWATAICQSLLDPFDPRGAHCDPKT